MPVQYSITVPTYKEQGNLEELVQRLTTAMEKAGHPRTAFEITVVDDNSRDGSEETIKKLAASGYPCQILVRTTERGLSSAVIHGFNNAKGKFLLCMDADLQHPPEIIPSLFAQMEKGVEFCIGTRYGEGVEISKDWPVHRRIISWGARMLARPLMPLNALSDPMTGLFCIRKDIFEAAMAKKAVSGLGFKICLELFIKCGITKHSEVTFNFGTRNIGESKLSSKVMVHYVKHLDQLLQFKYGIGAIAFVAIAAVLVLFILYKLYGLL
jgi:dolichol-phosphate mannosyltransferase